MAKQSDGNVEKKSFNDETQQSYKRGHGRRRIFNLSNDKGGSEISKDLSEKSPLFI